MRLTGEQVIGQGFSKEGKKTFHAVNPAAAEKLHPDFYEATEEEVERAVKSAAEAFVHLLRSRASQRADFLNQIAQEILALGSELISRCQEETALAENRLLGERARTVNQLKLFAEVVREGSWVDARIDTALADRQPVPRPDIRQVHMPLGPVGVFGASNFPLAFSVAGGDTASALAAGCPVIVKAHPAHPGTSEMVARAVARAARKTGMPEGIFSMLQAESPQVGLALVNHHLVKAIGFTGSFKGGKAIFDAAVRRPEPIPVYAEMGSTNPVFLLPAALEERGESIARGLSDSVTLGVGQFCTNPGLVIAVKSPAFDTLLQKLGQYLSDTGPGIMLSAKIKKDFERGIENLINSKGVKILVNGGKGLGDFTAGSWLLQTSSKNLLANPALGEEVFGPSTLAVTCENGKELLQAAAALPGHLTATIHCTDQDLKDYTDLVPILELKVGRLIINGFPTGVEVCPAMHHGGPFPATTDIRTTSVGTAAIKRFARPICCQNFPEHLLPPELQNHNPLNIFRLVNGEWTKEPIGH